VLLACIETRLTHPVSREPLILKAPLAEDFQSLLEKLGWAMR